MATEVIYLGRDSVTRGDWHNGTDKVYGNDGYRVISGPSSQTWLNNPSYVSAFSATQSPFTWTTGAYTSQALMQGPPSTDKYRSAWYRTPNLPINVTVSDNDWHQVAIYAFDDSISGRNQDFQILDQATSTVLDTRSVTSTADFVLGHWWVWAIKGSFRVNIVQTASWNAVYSAICWDQWSPNTVGFTTQRGSYLS